MNDALKFALFAVRPLAALLDDDQIIEIMVNGKDSVFVERLGGRPELSAVRLTKEQLEGVLANLANLSRKTVDLHGDDGHLIISARLPGFRIEAQLPPVAIHGPYITIRRHSSKALSLLDYVASGALTESAAEVLRKAIRDRANVLVAGGTSTGKTTFLNALIKEIYIEEALLSIETVAELIIPHPNTRRFEADDEQGYSVQRLVKSALRSRPDRIIVGEVRGGEAFDFVDAANTGHPGSMASLHANSATEALDRLENLVLEGRPAMPLIAIRKRIGDTIDLVVHMERVAIGGRFVRRLGEIVAIQGYDRAADSYCLSSIFKSEEP